MRIIDLPSPGLLNNSIRLRTELAKAVSAVEIASRQSGGTSTGASTLYACLSAARAWINSMRDVTAPTPVSRTAPTGGATKITVTFSEGLDPKIVPDKSAFVFSPAKTISDVSVVGKTLVITTTVAVANGNTLAYTQPSVNRLQDQAQNEVASWTAAAIVVS